MPGKGTEQGLMLHLARIVNSVTAGGGPMPELDDVGPLDPDYSAILGGGSANHKLLRVAKWFVNWCFSSLAAQRETPTPYLRLRKVLTQQEIKGHMKIGNANELFTASHGQLWLAAMGTILWAIQSTGRGLPALPFVYRWFRDHLRLCELCVLPVSSDFKEPLIWGPGARAWLRGKSKGGSPIAHNAARDLAFRLVYNLPTPEPDRALWRHKYNLGPHTLMLVSPGTRAELMPKEGHIPPLSTSFQVWRKGDEFVATLGDMSDALEPTLTTGCLDGSRFVSEERDAVIDDGLRFRHWHSTRIQAVRP